MNQWEIVFMDYSGNLVKTGFTGSLYDLANYYPHNSNGSSSIISAKKIPVESNTQGF